MSRLPESIADRRRFLERLVPVAIAAADPEHAVARVASALRKRDPEAVPWVLAVGKAAVAMARGAKLGDPRAVGLVVAPAPAGSESSPALEGFQVVFGDHPIPGPGSAQAGEAVLMALLSLPARARVLCLFSGGASSLCEVPIAGVSFEDVQTMTRVLLASGLPIDVTNAARGAVSALKAGRMRLLLDAAGRAYDTWLVSDVPSDDPTVIASGPMDAPGALARERLLELTRSNVFSELPASVQKAVMRYEPLDGTGAPSRVLLSGRTVANVLAKVATAEGLETRVLGPLCGEAAACGKELATRALDVACTIWFGETTVSMPPTRPVGQGGRNQELALAFAAALPSGSQRVALALATDGVDGTSTHAGAVVDAGTVARGEAQGDTAALALENHDAGAFLVRAGDALHTGPTGVNVSDITLVLR